MRKYLKYRAIIIGKGSHDELLRQGGRYQNYYYREGYKSNTEVNGYEEEKK